MELLTFNPGKTPLLAEAKSCICFLRNAPELGPPLSKSNNAVFIGEEERREEDCRLKLVWNGCLTTAPPARANLVIAAGESRGAKTRRRRAAVTLSNVFMPTDDKSRRISYFWHYGRMLNQKKLLTRGARCSGDGSWAKRLNHGLSPNSPK